MGQGEVSGTGGQGEVDGTGGSEWDRGRWVGQGEVGGITLSGDSAWQCLFTQYFILVCRKP